MAVKEPTGFYSYLILHINMNKPNRCKAILLPYLIDIKTWGCFILVYDQSIDLTCGSYP